MRVFVLSLILIASLFGFGFGFDCSFGLSLPCQAQSPLLGEAELIRELNLAAGAMRTYRKTHETFPAFNGQYKPPSSWNAPAHTIVVFSDGQNQFAAWVAGQDGKPIDDPTSHVPLIIYETIDPQADAKP